MAYTPRPLIPRFSTFIKFLTIIPSIPMMPHASKWRVATHMRIVGSRFRHHVTSVPDHGVALTSHAKSPCPPFLHILSNSMLATKISFVHRSVVMTPPYPRRPSSILLWFPHRSSSLASVPSHFGKTPLLHHFARLHDSDAFKMKILAPFACHHHYSYRPLRRTSTVTSLARSISRRPTRFLCYM